ncbi:MAG: hypothetical protein QXO94_06500 [Candidatus Bathyarchaeia archaeon]
MIPPPGWFFSSQQSLKNRQKAYFELHPCDPSCQIGQDTKKHMGRDILYPPHSDFLESISLLENTVKSFNDGSLFVETGKGFAVPDRSHSILDLIIFLKIEDGSISGSPADGAKEALLGFLFEEAQAEFESLSSRFSSLDRVLSTSWIFYNDRSNLILSQVACIFREFIPCISDDGIDLFIYGPEVFLRFFSKFFKKPSIPFISWRDLDSQWDRQICISDLQMDFSAKGGSDSVGIAKEIEVFAFSAPSSIRTRSFSFDGRGLDGELEVFFFNETEGLGDDDDIDDDLGEGFFKESLSEVMKGVVVGSISVGEAPEVGDLPL